MKNRYHLSPSEEELSAGLTGFVREKLPTLCTSAHRGESPFPREVFDELGKLGLTGVSIPEELGGLHASSALQATIFDLLAQTDLGPAIFLSVHGMVSGLINRFGSEEQRKKLLPPLARGEQLAAFALSEPEAGSDAAALSTTLTKNEDHYLLTGEKCWITSAGAADLYLVFARLAGSTGKDGVTALLIQKELPGMTIGKPEKKMGCELSPIGTLSFENARVERSAILGELGKGMEIAYGGLIGGRINIAACANGIATTALARTTQYISERKQFQQRLADFQGIQFRIAQMQISLDAAILLVREAAHEYSAKPSNGTTRQIAAEAKYFATEAAMRITTDAVQLHGAMGYMQETGIEKLMRDAKMLQIVEGANEIQLGIIARELLRR